jgi:hypothetical protein
MKADEQDFVLSPSDANHHPDNSEMTTLGNLLRNGQRRLTRRQRYYIALTLASSHYQLRNTPWLESGWNKDRIHFLCESSDPTKVSLEQPFISSGHIHSDSGVEAGSGRPDDTLPALGVMLLELCFNVPFEEQEFRKKYLSPGGQSNPYLDLAAAMEWCNSDAAEEAGPEFADAVRFCLGQFGAAPLDEKKRQEILEKVIKPLQFCHQQFELGGIA